MTNLLSPKDFNLPSRTKIEQLDEKTIALIIERKSRIIMADGRKILEKARTIQQQLPRVSVILKSTAPVCSKTREFLESEGVQISPY